MNRMNGNMPIPTHRLHDISDKIWDKIEPLLPGRKGRWGGITKDNRLFINVVFWLFRNGCSDLRGRAKCSAPKAAIWRTKSNTGQAFLSGRNLASSVVRTKSRVPMGRQMLILTRLYNLENQP